MEIILFCRIMLLYWLAYAKNSVNFHSKKLMPMVRTMMTFRLTKGTLNSLSTLAQGYIMHSLNFLSHYTLATHFRRAV